MADMDDLLSTERATGTLSRVDRYRWTVSDEVGTFAWIKKTDLNVDHTYQREVSSNNRLLKIARDWSWIACGVLLVARRSDLSFWIMDGQHRHAAAMKRSDVKELPCMIFNVRELRQEAMGFEGANMLSKAVRSYDKYKVQLVKGDPEAELVQSLLESTNHRLSDGAVPRGVRCIGALLNMARLEPDRFREAWALFCDAHGDGTFNERVVRGLWWLHKATDGRVMAKHHRERITALGKDGLLAAANKASAFYAEGGERVWGLGIHQALNRGLRSRQLEITNAIFLKENASE